MTRTTVVVSDVHLGAIPPARERAFLDFLEAVPRIGLELLIAGDLFDFWIEYGQVVPRGYLPALARLRRLVEAGVRVRLLGGNHDGWAGDFLADEVGLEVVHGPAVIDVSGRRAFVAHGDGLGGGDLGYRVLKRVIRSRLGSGLFRILHPDIGVPLARLASSTEDSEPGDSSVPGSRAARLAACAERLLREDPSLDLIVLGHAHEPRLDRIEGRRFYLNPGDWVHHCSYGVVSADAVRLETWPTGGSGEGEAAPAT